MNVSEQFTAFFKKGLLNISLVVTGNVMFCAIEKKSLLHLKSLPVLLCGLNFALQCYLR